MSQSPVSSPSSELTEVVIDAQYVIGMGYGHVWRARVREGQRPPFGDSSFDLSLFDNSSGVDYGGRFADFNPQVEVHLTLRQIATRPAALAGFVSEDGTIWQVVNIH